MPATDEFNTLGIPKNKTESKSILINWMHDNLLTEIINYTFAIDLLPANQFIGLIGLKRSAPKYNSAEVWFKLHPGFWKQGFATESLNKILDVGFDKLKLHRITAGCAVDNTGSINVLEKVGMSREGRGRKILPLKSGWSDNYEYAILETDGRPKPSYS